MIEQGRDAYLQQEACSLEMIEQGRGAYLRRAFIKRRRPAHAPFETESAPFVHSCIFLIVSFLANFEF